MKCIFADRMNGEEVCNLGTAIYVLALKHVTKKTYCNGTTGKKDCPFWHKSCC